MTIRAYDEDYISGAQNVLGHAVDFAVMSLNIEPDTFGKYFVVSDVSKQFANGNPRYVAGMNGCELARRVLEETRVSISDVEDAMYLDKSPEFWSGWILAFYQWYTGRSFKDILTAIPLSQIIRMYEPYHEMDIMQSVDKIDSVLKEYYPVVRLKMRREICGYSQSELATVSNVPLRQIQLFEQKKRDINKTAAETLLQLSKALHCKMEDLIEY